jgi:LMBR1 domain-containing protein 1
MELFLIIVLAVFLFIFFMIAMKIMWTYESPEDDWRCGTVLPKLVFILAVMAAFLMAIILPMDVENMRSEGVGLEEWWSVLYTIVLCIGCGAIPMAVFLYEALDDIGVSNSSRIPFLLIRLLVFLVFVVVGIALLYSYANTSLVPVFKMTCPQYVWDAPQVENPTSDALCRGSSKQFLKMQLKLTTYLVAITSFIGWIFFVIFGSVGMTALPLDLIYSFTNRPTASDIQKYNAQKQVLGEQAKELGKFGKELQDKEREVRGKSGFGASRQKGQISREFNKFRQSVYLLEMEFKKIEIGMQQRGENPVVSYSKLISGIFLFILGTVWIIHCILYVLFQNFNNNNEPLTPFLNNIFTYLGTGDGGYIGSFILFMLMNMWLLATAVKGAIKWGMKLFCLPIFPLVEKDTPLNSLLFNALIILLSSGAVSHLTWIAFQDYAYASSAVYVFGTQVAYLTFYTWFFSNNVMIWIYCAFTIIGGFLVLWLGRDKPAIRNKKKLEEYVYHFTPVLFP